MMKSRATEKGEEKHKGGYRKLPSTVGLIREKSEH